ncbi:MAG: hypothetical protein IPP74_04895 [Alphaproteobacteria bacterium]|nr:hypothetical protein [Alphaproteobacteria bacterium]
MGKFSVEVINVFRDCSQGLYGNRIPLNDPNALEMFARLNSLSQLKSPSGMVAFGTIETGGAQPQVDLVFRNTDALEVMRQVRQAATDCTQRPLFRGANGFNLGPKSLEEIQFILTQLAENTAGSHLKSDNPELLRIKAFDSQGVIGEVESTVHMVSQLRNHGFPISIEVAIPYGNGAECDPLQKDFNPYPDEFYIEKVVAAAKLAEQYNIPEHAFRISLKDMAGELDSTSSARLFSKIISRFKEEGLTTKLGLHLHDTGLAADAYAAAIHVCHEQDWPIAIDTVERRGTETGFASTLDVCNVLKETYNIYLGLTEEQQIKLAEIGEITDQLMDAYRVRRVQVNLSGEDLRFFKIPGGGLASFESAVQAAGISDQLGLSHDEAVKLAGHALIAVGRLMGNPFAVTPGFQNKQIAALNLLKNMIQQGFLQKGKDSNTLNNKVISLLTDEEVSTYFLKGLTDVVKEFLKGQMPSPVHHVVRAALPLREGLLTDGLVSSLPPTRQVVTRLQEDGFIKPTPLQALSILQKAITPGNEQEKLAELLACLNKCNVTHEKPDGIKDPQWTTRAVEALSSLHGQQILDCEAFQIDQLVDELKETTINSGIFCAIILGHGEYTHRVMRPWFHEPDPSLYANRSEYNRALSKFQKGLSSEPDSVEFVRQQWVSSQKDLEKTKENTALLLAKEGLDIQYSVLDYAHNHQEDVYHMAGSLLELCLAEGRHPNAAALKGPFIQAIHTLYEQQKGWVNDSLSLHGTQFLFPQGQRIDNALAFFRSYLVAIITRMNPAIAPSLLQHEISSIIDEVKKEIESATSCSKMPGQIIMVHVEPGQSVSAGDLLYTIEAMKMQLEARADKNQVVSNVLVKKGDNVSIGKPLIQFQQNDIQDMKLIEHADHAQQRSPLPEKIDAFFKGEFARLDDHIQQVNNRIAQIGQQPESSSETPASKPALTKQAQQGYHTAQLTLRQRAGHDNNNAIHVIGNRSGCAVKLLGDFKQYGYDVRVLYTPGDITTPIIQHAEDGTTIKVSSYTNQDEILGVLKQLAKANPMKTIVFHPGWGFLSEKDDFVKRMEDEVADDDIVFAGPASRPMKQAGGKASFRDLVAQVAPDFNPKYIKNDNVTTQELSDYIESGFCDTHRLHEPYTRYFREVLEMGGDVMVKAIAGGGGRGIYNFKYDGSLLPDDNYHSYVKTVYQTIRDGEHLFDDGQVLTERCLRGNSHHIEVQFAATNAQAITLGIRNCTAQIDKQKFAEMNVITGDYSAELISKINKAAQDIAEKLAADGYNGLGTLEMLVLPESEEVMILEVNTRIQVEHGVTEKVLELITGKRISLPILNTHLTAFRQGQTPQSLLMDLFGLTETDISRLNELTHQRVTHFRINSKHVSLPEGTATPSWFGTGMWYNGVSEDIAQRTGITIIEGGLGKGDCDSQIGALLGEEAQVLNAAKQLLTAFRLAQTFERVTDTTNLEATLKLYRLLFNSDGTVNKAFGTCSVDEFLKATREGKIDTIRDTNRFPLWPGQQLILGEKLHHNLLHRIDRQDNSSPCQPATDVAMNVLHGKKWHHLLTQEASESSHKIGCIALR